VNWGGTRVCCAIRCASGLTQRDAEFLTLSRCDEIGPRLELVEFASGQHATSEGARRVFDRPRQILLPRGVGVSCRNVTCPSRIPAPCHVAGRFHLVGCPDCAACCAVRRRSPMFGGRSGRNPLPRSQRQSVRLLLAGNATDVEPHTRRACQRRPGVGPTEARSRIGRPHTLVHLDPDWLWVCRHRLPRGRRVGAQCRSRSRNGTTALRDSIQRAEAHDSARPVVGASVAGVVAETAGPTNQRICSGLGCH